MSMGLDGIRPHPGFYARVWPRTVLPVNIMRGWWCNQSKCWAVERRAELVIGNCNTDQPAYRQTVVEVKAGDITLHYVRPQIRAVSLAMTDAQYSDTLPIIGPESYDFGWSFKAEYFDFDPPIPVDDVRGKIVELLRTQPAPRETGFAFLGPKQARPGDILPSYFLRFSLAGLQVVKNASKVKWPEWVP